MLYFDVGSTDEAAGAVDPAAASVVGGLDAAAPAGRKLAALATGGDNVVVAADAEASKLNANHTCYSHINPWLQLVGQVLAIASVRPVCLSVCHAR